MFAGPSLRLAVASWFFVAMAAAPRQSPVAPSRPGGRRRRERRRAGRGRPDEGGLRDHQRRRDAAHRDLCRERRTAAVARPALRHLGERERRHQSRLRAVEASRSGSCLGWRRTIASTSDRSPARSRSAPPSRATRRSCSRPSARRSTPAKPTPSGPSPIWDAVAAAVEHTRQDRGPARGVAPHRRAGHR